MSFCTMNSVIITTYLFTEKRFSPYFTRIYGSKAKDFGAALYSYQSQNEMNECNFIKPQEFCKIQSINNVNFFVTSTRFRFCCIFRRIRMEIDCRNICTSRPIINHFHAKKKPVEILTDGKLTTYFKCYHKFPLILANHI